tara:strand:+ start:175 stop:462 length:288 start_codon:yes stop_codon:yes gene_type:complete
MKKLPIKEIVYNLLVKNGNLRDNDNKLVVEVWREEFSAYNITYSFFNAYSEGKITPADTITRCRRKIQQEIPALRGAKYEARHKRAEFIRKTING